MKQKNTMMELFAKGCIENMPNRQLKTIKKMSEKQQRELLDTIYEHCKDGFKKQFIESTIKLLKGNE